jgi:hypothetical protein
MPFGHPPVDDADERHDAAIGVEVRVEDERLERCIRIALGSRDFGDHGFQRGPNTLA